MGVGISRFPEGRIRMMLSFTRSFRQSRYSPSAHTSARPFSSFGSAIRSLNGSTTCHLLGSLSNGTRFGNFPARLLTATTRLGGFPHCFAMLVFFALGCTSITDISADATKLMCKQGISRQQSCTNATYWRALVAKPDGSCHLRGIMCETLIDTS